MPMTTQPTTAPNDAAPATAATRQMGAAMPLTAATMRPGATSNQPMRRQTALSATRTGEGRRWRLQLGGVDGDGNGVRGFVLAHLVSAPWWCRPQSSRAAPEATTGVRVGSGSR